MCTSSNTMSFMRQQPKKIQITSPGIILDDNPASPSMFSPAGDITPTGAEAKNKA